MVLPEPRTASHGTCERGTLGTIKAIFNRLPLPAGMLGPQQHLLLAEAALALPTLLAPGSEPDALQAIGALLQRPTPAAGSGHCQHGSRGREADTSSPGTASASGAPPEAGQTQLAVLLAAAEQALHLLCASGSNLAVAAAGSTFAQIEGQPNRSACTSEHPGRYMHLGIKQTLLRASKASHTMPWLQPCCVPPLLLRVLVHLLLALGAPANTAATLHFV